MTKWDVAVYGGTPAGVIAAVAAARQGVSVVLLEQKAHVGGLNTSGLNTSETEHMLPVSFSGLNDEFYRRIGRAYGLNMALHRWESHVAERVFLEMLDEARVEVRYGCELTGVEKRDGRIASIALGDGSRIDAGAFVDATYEGDLMAAAGVAYTFGRESRAQYDESLAGIRFNDRPEEVEVYREGRQIDMPIDVSPYDDDGRLLPGFVSPEGIVVGESDRKVMNYNFRITVSNAADRVPFSPPPRYDRRRFIGLERYLRLRPETSLHQLIDFYNFPSGRYELDPKTGGWKVVPTHKKELNNRQSAIFSLGHFGGQFDYPDAAPAQRRAIFDDHREHNQGLLWFLSTDPAVPAPIRDELSGWGLARDEYADNGHWPYYLYVREARRMIGRYVLTQHDVRPPKRQRPGDDSIHTGSHWIDSHHVQRVAISRTQFRNEGRIWLKTDEPFPVPYGCITPREEECGNLLVPVCASASHVAFCTLRLESTWMALGHACGNAAALAVRGGTSVQGLDVQALRDTLRADGVILEP